MAENIFGEIGNQTHLFADTDLSRPIIEIRDSALNI